MIGDGVRFRTPAKYGSRGELVRAAGRHAVERHREDVPVGGRGVRAVAQLRPCGDADSAAPSSRRGVNSPHPRVLPHVDAVRGRASRAARRRRAGRAAPSARATTNPSRWRRKPSTNTLRAYFSPTRSTVSFSALDQHHAPEAVDGRGVWRCASQPVEQRRVGVGRLAQQREPARRRRGACRRA